MKNDLILEDERKKIEEWRLNYHARTRKYSKIIYVFFMRYYLLVHFG